MGNLDVTIVATVVAWILIGLGIVMIFLPVGPSIPTVWFGMFIYAVSHDYILISRNFMIIITAIAALTIFMDYTLFRYGVQKFRAGPWGVMGAIIGFIVGSLINPVVAFIIGPVVGALALEMLRGHDQVYSWKTGNTTVVAFMGGTVVKLMAALAMVGFFVLRLQGKL